MVKGVLWICCAPQDHAGKKNALYLDITPAETRRPSGTYIPGVGVEMACMHEEPLAAALAPSMTSAELQTARNSSREVVVRRV